MLLRVRQDYCDLNAGVQSPLKLSVCMWFYTSVERRILSRLFEIRYISIP